MLSHNVSVIRGVTVLTLSGEIDMAVDTDLGDAFLAALPADGRTLVVDLSAVDFFDSTGLRALDTLDRSARTKQNAVVLAGPNDRIIRVLQMTGLGERFKVFPTADEAILATVDSA